MTHEEAMQCALGYAWGREDASGIKTAGDRPVAFAEAFAQGWNDYNLSKRWFMFPVSQAYERWQATGATTIFMPGESTSELRDSNG